MNDTCVDCCTNQSTYFVMNFGIFICENCAAQHAHYFPCSRHYMKEIFTETWDPTQLKFLEIASNKPAYDLFRQYFVHDKTIEMRYHHNSLDWYEKKVAHLACGRQFNMPPPTILTPSFDEGLTMGKKNLAAVGDKVTSGFRNFFK